MKIHYEFPSMLKKKVNMFQLSVAAFLFLFLLMMPLFSLIAQIPGDYARFFSINPGITLRTYELNIQSGSDRLARMTHRGDAIIDWQLDIKSRRFKLTDSFGIYMMIHNSPLRFTRQKVRVSSDNACCGDGEEDMGGSSGGTIVNMDVGSRLDGIYTAALPVLYYGITEKWLIGAGAGKARLKLSGNVNFDDPYPGYIAALLEGKTREERLNLAGSYILSRGTVDLASGDPILNHLIVNISKPGVLADAGRYALLKDQAAFNFDSIMRLFLWTGAGYNLMEAVALNYLAGQTPVNLTASNVNAFMLYTEFALGKYGTMRMSVGGPIFSIRGYNYELISLDIAVYFPLKY